MEEFLSFIADILEVDKNTLTLETSQDDVETWDSLMQLRLLGEIEAKYGVMIPVSYTHLDVYKRQVYKIPEKFCAGITKCC